MKTMFKYAAAATLAGVLALAAVTPSEARDGRNAAAAIGFGAGALFGAAVAGSYNRGYYDYGYYDGGYAYYDPGPAYYSDYAYEPGPVYVQPGPTYYGRPYYRSNSNCNSSPASPNYGVAC